MSENNDQAVTRILDEVVQGKARAEELLPLLYDELRRLARSRLARLAPGQTLQATALVHEAYLRVVGDLDPGWDRRGHFFAAAARAMREILIEQARRKASLKRGGDRKRVRFENLVLAIDAPAVDMLSLDEALRRLKHEYPRQHDLVELRFFAGLSAEEAARALETSLRTVERDWSFARAWLHSELSVPEAEPSGPPES